MPLVLKIQYITGVTMFCLIKWIWPFITRYPLLAQTTHNFMNILTPIQRYQATTVTNYPVPILCIQGHLYHLNHQILHLHHLLHKAGDHSEITRSLATMWTFCLRQYLFSMRRNHCRFSPAFDCICGIGPDSCKHIWFVARISLLTILQSWICCTHWRPQACESCNNWIRYWA